MMYKYRNRGGESAFIGVNVLGGVNTVDKHSPILCIMQENSAYHEYDL